MANKLYLFLKRGDKICAPGKEYIQLRHNMPVCYYDEGESRIPISEAVSEYCRKCFTVLEVNPAQKAYIQSILRPVGLNLATGQFDKRISCIRPVVYDIEMISKQLAADVTNKDFAVDVIDAKAFDTTIFKDQALFAAKAVVDKNAVSAGSYTYGTGGNYATRALAYADIANLTGDLTFTQISDTVETAAAFMTESFGGFTLTDTSNSPPNGDATAGWKSTMGADTDNMIDQRGEGPGTFEIKNLRLMRSAACTAAYRTIIVTDNTTAFTYKIHDNIFIGKGDAGDKVRGIYTGDNGNLVRKIWNNIIANMNYGLEIVSTAAAGSNNENNDIYNSLTTGVNITNASVPILRNNRIMTAGTACIAGNSTAFGYNNLTTDATGADGNWHSGSSGNAASQTAADQVVSLDQTNSNFLKTKDSTSGGEGTAPQLAENTAGARGTARPQVTHYGTFYGIGADELAVYNMAYNANGGSGTAPTTEGYMETDTVTVSAATGLTRAGYTFSHWNTAANGSGTSYNPAATFTMPAAAVVLYAQWAANAATNTPASPDRPYVNPSFAGDPKKSFGNIHKHGLGTGGPDA